MLKLRKNKKGFTLVELIVVIAIMAVLAGTIAGVTVSQLNKQTNNTAKSEAKSLASDLHNFMIDYKLAGAISVENLKTAVNEFVSDNKQSDNIEVIQVGGEGNPTAAPTSNATITGNTKDFKAGDHKFYAFVYSATEGGKTVYKVRFCCKQKGSGNNQFPFADYTYSDVLADN